MSWNLEDVEVGGYIETEVVNKKSDHNLDGVIIRGTIVALVPTHNMARLDSGWCVHTKDNLLRYSKPLPVIKPDQPEGK